MRDTATRLKIQLWSYNYDPEPTGIGPLATTVAGGLLERGHDVEVVAACAHYPTPVWGSTLRVRREVRDGIRVLRLPIRVGRSSVGARIGQELSFVAGLTAAIPFLGTPDVIVAVSPSFPALSSVMAASRVRRVPWVLWLQDMLPDGAVASKLMADNALLRSLRKFESAAYRSASTVVAISDSFVDNLRSKGVPAEKIVRIYNPATLELQPTGIRGRAIDERLVLTMGNIGRTQNLAQVVSEFQASHTLQEMGAHFVLAGDGVAADEVRAMITDQRIQITGVLGRADLRSYLSRAAVAVVSQQYDGVDFNVPSKLMNFMAWGIPTVGAVRTDSEVGRLLRESGSGWVADVRRTEDVTSVIATALRDRTEREDRGDLALSFARNHFSPSAVTEQFEAVLDDVVRRAGRRRR